MLAIAIRAAIEAVSFVAFLVLLFSGTYVANEIYLAVKKSVQKQTNSKRGEYRGEYNGYGRNAKTENNY